MNRTAENSNAFSPDSMPELGRKFIEIWHDRDGKEVTMDGDLNVWLRYIALYGYPKAARWRYA